MILAAKLRKLAADLIATADALQKTASVESVGTVRYVRDNALLGKHQLTRAQAKILDALLDNRGVCVTREDLNCLLFGPNAADIDSRTIDSHICALRKLLKPGTIQTVNGRGYKI